MAQRRSQVRRPQDNSPEELARLGNRLNHLACVFAIANIAINALPVSAKAKFELNFDAATCVTAVCPPSLQKCLVPLTDHVHILLTHFDAQGQAHMVDVGAKPATHRIAVASGRIEILPATFALIESGIAKKGDVLGIAHIAGIMAAKKTNELIPL